MKLISNADNILLTKLQNNSVQADFEALKDNVNNGYVTQYVKNMQSYICKIALIISELCEDIKVKSKYSDSDGTYYPNALDFLCDEVIQNPKIKEALTSINEQANAAKHTTKTINKKWIESTLPAYNELIDELIDHTKLENFKICRIRNISHKSKEEMIPKPSMCNVCKKVFSFSQENSIYECSNCNLYVCEDCYSKQVLKCNRCFQQEQERIKQIDDIKRSESELQITDLEKLAELGDGKSSYDVAKYYLNPRSENYDKKKGIRYLIMYVAANPSDAEELYNLGKYFSEDKDIAKDLNSAANYYKCAKQQFEIQANNHSLRALYMLGICYEQGYGCSKSPKRAISYYVQAANQGYADAEFKLGSIYLEGIVVSRDIKEAEKNFFSAANHGNYEALTILKRDFPIKKSKYLELLEKFADNGIKEAQEELAGIYEKKEETITKAYDLYKRCNKTEKIQELRNIIDIIEKVNSGDPESKYKLWEEYQRVDGVLSSDATREQELLRQSAEGNYGLAQYHYALTFKGKDNVKYINWLQKAADSGIGKAREELTGYYETEKTNRSEAAALKWNFLKAFVVVLGVIIFVVLVVSGLLGLIFSPVGLIIIGIIIIIKLLSG